MKRSLVLIKSDIRKFILPLFLIILYFSVSNILFDEVCPSKLIVGFPCPACGITRAFVLFFTGHPIQAFYMHPMFILVILISILFVIMRYILFVPTGKLKNYIIALIIISIALYFVRMVAYPGKVPLNFYQKSIIGKTLYYFIAG